MLAKHLVLLNLCTVKRCTKWGLGLHYFALRSFDNGDTKVNYKIPPSVNFDIQQEKRLTNVPWTLHLVHPSRTTRLRHQFMWWTTVTTVGNGNQLQIKARLFVPCSSHPQTSIHLSFICLVNDRPSFLLCTL